MKHRPDVSIFIFMGQLPTAILKENLNPLSILIPVLRMLRSYRSLFPL